MSELPDSVTKGKLSKEREDEGTPVVDELTRVRRKEPIHRNKFYGSDVGYCPRKSVAFRLIPESYQVPISISSEFYMGIGNAIHEIVVELLGEKVIEAEAYVSHDTVEVGGRVDAILEEEDGKNTFLEIKSCGRIPPKPRKQHQYQVGMYGFLAGIERMKLLYVSRNVADWTGKLLCVEYLIDPKFIRKAAKNMAISQKFYEKKTIPPIPEHIKKSDCRFCALLKYCWEDKGWDTLDLKLPSEKVVDKIMEEAKTYFHELIDSWEPNGKIVKKEIEKEE